MSTKPEAGPATTSEAPTRESRRQEFRKLMMVLLGCIVVSWAAAFFAPVPERFVEASIAEIENMPEWRFWTGMAAAVVLACIQLFGLYRLWTFKADGMGYVGLSMFFPIFFMLPLTLSMSAFEYYVQIATSFMIGIVLYACWSNPDLFERSVSTDAAPQLAAGADASAGSTGS